MGDEQLTHQHQLLPLSERVLHGIASTFIQSDWLLSAVIASTR